jgi:uncharacterized protein (TIGR02588 family)
MSNKKPVTPLWEKIVGMLGLVLLCFGFAYLSWEKLTKEKSPLHISFAVGNIIEVETEFLVRINVENTGFQSATALQVEGVLSKDGKEMESHKMQIDYIPSNSDRSIGFFFKQDPRLGTLEFRALGFQEP